MKAFIQNIYLEESLPDSNTSRDFLIWLKNTIVASIQKDIRDNNSCGLYIATADLGAASSIQFWRDALTDGFAFANPREFPMTLSNALASMIAIQLDITGPNYTFVGHNTAHNDAFIQALLDLKTMNIDECLIVKMPPLVTGTDNADKQTVITHLVSENNMDNNALASLKICPKENDKNNLKMMDEAIDLLIKKQFKDDGYCIQTDIKSDLLMQLI
jgi:hypothetical protein